MKKFNVIIAARGRVEHLRFCLESLIRASKGSDVIVYVVSDDFDTLEDMFSEDLEQATNTRARVYSVEVHKKYSEFNKSYLLNYGLEVMREDFDYVSIIDADMIYNPKFFETMSTAPDDLYCVSGGYKLKEDETYIVMGQNVPYQNIQELVVAGDLKSGAYCRNSKQAQSFPSQITVSKKLYKKLLNILRPDPLYREEFIGWGGEDSLVSEFSIECEKQKLFRKQYFIEMWHHLWHPSAVDNELMKTNFQILKQRIAENKIKVEEYAAKGAR